MNANDPAERLDRRPVRDPGDVSSRVGDELRYVKKILADATRAHGAAFASGLIIRFGADGMPHLEHRDATVSPTTVRALWRRLDAAMGLRPGASERRAHAIVPQRAAGEAGAGLRRPVLNGLAIVFDSLSEDLGGFRERISHAAVGRTLREGRDVLALMSHDTAQVLGRVSAGTLQLSADPRGLHVTIEPPDTGVGRDTVTLVGRRDLLGMSFGFRTIADEWTQDRRGDVVREVTDMLIHEVSIVAAPAYPATSVNVRGGRRPIEDLRRRHERARVELFAARRRLMARWN